LDQIWERGWMGLVARMGSFIVEQIQKGRGIEVRIVIK
jgi:hypothetical protein